jgi:Spy/CpxP family protein refolding chaperone
MTSLSRRQGRRLHLIAGAVFAGLIAVTTLPALGSAQAPAPSGSQGGGGSMQGGGGGRMMASLMQGITLTDAQQKSIDGIRSNYMPQLQAARSAQNRDQMRTLMTQETGDIRKVLTPDQQTVFDKNLATMRANMQNGQGGGGQH